MPAPRRRSPQVSDAAGTGRGARRLGTAGLIGFAAIVAAQHLAQPLLDPLEHMISEYARTSTGWLMTIGFGLWALSLAATAHWVRSESAVVSGLLFVAASGLVVLATFRTQTSAGELAYGSRLATGGRLHDAGSAVATLAILAAACVLVGGRYGTVALRRVVATLLAASVIASFVLLAIGPSVGGVRQRLLQLAACGLQLAVLKGLRR